MNKRALLFSGVVQRGVLWKKIVIVEAGPNQDNEGTIKKKKMERNTKNDFGLIWVLSRRLVYLGKEWMNKSFDKGKETKSILDIQNNYWWAFFKP